MPRGGKRQGTPGKAYSNRTDLGMNYMPGEAASGGINAPVEQMPAIQLPDIAADQVPNIGDISTRPMEPVTAGLPIGLGAGPEAIGPMPPSPMDPVRQIMQALMINSPNPDLVRILNRLDYEGR
jgi:hypothetical protein